ncbi:DUF456 domain-containing protein [Aldersonia sp. NBC_00410]|uniref:DUF456 domain-containing protein n=1 Tax=Aldersonia sp. NBC_00410 TaxID=2975954 RepID=UPI00225A8756|nr:DUF456 domain-containing protein [Aldersonia sp. NBC_00410]MCX5041975.1 DUF456 domain-containing protein [Aldersonia sp. NBC_00410]
MSVGGELLVGLAILIGLAGIVVPIVPGTVLIAAALLVWAIVVGTATAWTVVGVGLALLVVSGVVKYTWPGRRLRDAGVPNRSIIVGGLLGIVGFFVVPVVGLFLGFLLGTYLSEVQRLRGLGPAWPATVHATKAVGLSMLVELFGALAAAGIWLAAVLAS